MKLLELLVQELPKRGGWPDGALFCTQSVIDGEVYFYDRPYGGQGCMPKMKGKILLSISDDARMGCEGLYPVFTREQYEAALAAAQLRWDGEGLPPVGCECDVIVNKEWQKCEILVHTRFGAIDCAVFKTESILKCSPEGHFRPTRSEADKKRDAACDSMHKWWREVAGQQREDGSLIDIYSCIYDAIAVGKIPGVKLSD